MSFYSVFSMKLDGAEPSIRYFLAKYLWLYGDKDVVTKGVKALAKEIGVTDRIVSRALAFLVLNQYLERFDVINDKRKPGRPGNNYALSDKLIGLLSSYVAKNRVPIHLPLIAALMKDERSLRSVKSPTVLACSRCYFLCVLLFRADKFGVVACVGSAELGCYTGLSDQQIKRYTADLISSWYLVACYKGFNARSLSGRVTNTYVLNLGWHQDLKPADYELIVFEARHHKPVERLVGLAKALRMMIDLKTITADVFILASSHWFDSYDLPQFDPRKFFAASEIIASWGGRPIEAFIQWKIYSFASSLLTESISCGVYGLIKDELVEQAIHDGFGKEFFPKAKVFIDGETVEADMYALITDIVQKTLLEASSFLVASGLLKEQKQVGISDLIVDQEAAEKLYFLYPKYFSSRDMCVLIMNDGGFEYVQSSKTLHIPLIP